MTMMKTTEKYDHSLLDVLLTIAVSENGRVRCCLANSYLVKERQEYDAFMKEIREDKILWAAKTIKVGVRMPVSFEDIGAV